jgi:hypothetical protein
MRLPLRSVLSALAVLVALPVHAQFEGRLEYEVKQAPDGKEEGASMGRAVVWLSQAGARTEMAIPPQEGMPEGGRFATLWKRSEPGRVYFINDARKAYAAMDVDEEQPEADEKYRITRLGRGKVAGYACERARVAQGDDSGDELCISGALGKIPVHLAMDRRGLSLWNELRKAGLDGVPVSWRSGDEDGFSMVLTSARKQTVPRKLLEVPAGYSKTSVMGAFASPEQAKNMEEELGKLREQMKDMTPEQRAQIEKLLEQYAK